MKKIINWFIEPYTIATSELKLLIELKGQSESNAEKGRIDQLKYFNILLMLVYSVFFLGSIVYIILSFIIAWYGFVVLVVTIPMMALTKVMQKKRYLNRRDAFIKGDVS